MARDGIVGREAEQARLLELLERMPDGGAACVLRGEPGVGKSTLLGWAARRAAADGALVLSVVGVQAEFGVAYAGLHRLSVQLPPGTGSAPARARVVSAVGTDGPQVRPVLVALAFLELVTAAAHHRPVLLTVDDAQWLDAPSWEALTFVARRLHADPVLLLTAMRDGTESDSLLDRGGLAELRVPPLADAPAGALLDRRAPGLRPDLRRRVLAEAAGNPLGLVELAEVARRYGARGLPPAVLPLPARLERAFARSVAELPARTRTLLLVAAVDDGSGLDEIVAAAVLLDRTPITADDLAPAVAARLIVIEERLLVRFRHPLVRSALRQGAPVARRRAAHAALAATLTGQDDRRIWHRAEAADGADERLAADLTAAADAARRRGAMAIAVPALERAAQLSEDSQEAAGRVLRAADAAHELGDIETVVRLLRGLEGSTLRPAEQARLAWMREVFLTAGWSGASRMPAHVEIIERMRKDGDVELALDSLITISLRCFWSNPGRAVRDMVVAAAERLQVPPLDPRLVSTLALVAPLEHGAVVLPRIERLAAELTASPEDLATLATAASAVGAFPTSLVFSAVAVAALRGQGRLGTLAQALNQQATVAAQLGDIRLAVTAATEARAMALETGQPRFAVTADLARGYAEALRGHGEIARTLADVGEGSLLPVGAHPMLALVQVIRGVDALAEGRHVAAYEQLYRIFDPAEVPYHPVVQCWVLGHLVEAAVASGRGDEVRELVEELIPLGAAQGLPVLRVGLDYGTALLAGGDEAEAAFEAALATEQLGAWPFERARLQHAYGAWLRRHRRAGESRPHLRAATNAFDALGIVPWADRARAELRASGESVRRDPDARDRLTPQELQISHLAADGLSNRDIAERLFLSPRTVSTHLYRIFPKLGVTSRAELARALRVG
jgi:DNA-binding CsgD family transcriptional regulator